MITRITINLLVVIAISGDKGTKANHSINLTNIPLIFTEEYLSYLNNFTVSDKQEYFGHNSSQSNNPDTDTDYDELVALQTDAEDNLALPSSTPNYAETSVYPDLEADYGLSKSPSDNFYNSLERKSSKVINSEVVTPVAIGGGALEEVIKALADPLSLVDGTLLTHSEPFSSSEIEPMDATVTDEKSEDYISDESYLNFGRQSSFLTDGGGELQKDFSTRFSPELTGQRNNVDIPGIVNVTDGGDTNSSALEDLAPHLGAEHTPVLSRLHEETHHHPVPVLKEPSTPLKSKGKLYDFFFSKSTVGEDSIYHQYIMAVSTDRRSVQAFRLDYSPSPQSPLDVTQRSSKQMSDHAMENNKRDNRVESESNGNSLERKSIYLGEPLLVPGTLDKEAQTSTVSLLANPGAAVMSNLVQGATSRSSRPPLIQPEDTNVSVDLTKNKIDSQKSTAPEFGAELLIPPSVHSELTFLNEELHFLTPLDKPPTVSGGYEESERDYENTKTAQPLTLNVLKLQDDSLVVEVVKKPKLQLDGLINHPNSQSL